MRSAASEDVANALSLFQTISSTTFNVALSFSTMAAKKRRLMPDLDELEHKRRQTKSAMKGVEAAEQK